jgi:hypothetical protein
LGGGYDFLMPFLSESSPFDLTDGIPFTFSSLTTDVEKTNPGAYLELITSTLRRTTWFGAYLAYAPGQGNGTLARYDIAIGPENEEQDLIVDLGGAYTAGSGNAGSGNISTVFPFVIEQGVRLSARIRNVSSVGRNWFLQVRLFNLF